MTSVQQNKNSDDRICFHNKEQRIKTVLINRDFFVFNVTKIYTERMNTMLLLLNTTR
jgi:hypothetical protein